MQYVRTLQQHVSMRAKSQLDTGTNTIILIHT